MVRTTRVPLGNSAQDFVIVGDTDIDGRVVSPGEQGWYHEWWRALHCLMGKDGLDADMYLQRPSFK